MVIPSAAKVRAAVALPVAVAMVVLAGSMCRLHMWSSRRRGRQPACCALRRSADAWSALEQLDAGATSALRGRSAWCPPATSRGSTHKAGLRCEIDARARNGYEPALHAEPLRAISGAPPQAVPDRPRQRDGSVGVVASREPNAWLLGQTVATHASQAAAARGSR